MAVLNDLIAQIENEELRRLLLSTGDRVLIEGNTWNDTFWGVSLKSGNGQNHLGKILMRVRERLKQESKEDI